MTIKLFAFNLLISMIMAYLFVYTIPGLLA